MPWKKNVSGKSWVRMKKTARTTATEIFLGIEGGATRTIALAVNGTGRVLHRVEAGPANLQLLRDAQLVRHLRSVASRIQSPVVVAIGLAGARTESDRNRLRRAAEKVWPRVPCYATNDLETALMAAEGRKSEGQRSKVKGQKSEVEVRVLILSGTGSCCFGRTRDGRTAKIGGWGHILGDKGSGYEIGLRAAKAAVYYYDRDGEWPPLGQRILRALQLNEPNELIGWAQNASKAETASLAKEVFEAWKRNDKTAADILAGAAESLAKDAAACAQRLVKSGRPVQFILAGSILLKQPRFAQLLSRHLAGLWPGAIITPLKRESVWGAVELAKQEFLDQKLEAKTKNPKRKAMLTGKGAVRPENLHALASSPTEQRNPISMNLDQLSLTDAIVLMLKEDARIPSALLAERKKIERAVKLIVQSFKQGGRLFYAGAGTSGRLGVLDASECPPTFRTSPEMVQGIIAGGQRALWEAVEGAEDDPTAGAQAIKFRGVGRRDVVVGIAASGRTPFVWGVLDEAKRRRATTILLCFNPTVKIPSPSRPTLIIAPQVGPEILTGSTRLKAGTATKLILNILTTLSMVRLGKVVSNLMIDVKASNTKLRDRATRIVQELTHADYGTARRALEKANWKIKEACARLDLKR